MPVAPAEAVPSGSFVTGAASTSHTTGTLSGPIAAGDLLIAAFGVDKSAGTFTVPSGWTALANTPGTSVSTLIVWRLATGSGDPTSCTATWSTGVDGAAALITRWPGVNTADPLGPVLNPAYSNTARTSMALDPAAADAQPSVAVLFATIDSIESTTTTTNFRPTATGWTWQATAAATGNLGAPAVALTTRDAALTAGQNLGSTTFTWTVSEQAHGVMLLINEATGVTSGTGTGSAQTLGLTAGTGTGSQVYPKIGTLSDGFATADTTKWAFPASVSVAGGQLVCPTFADYRATVRSLGRYDLTDSGVAVEVVQAPTGPGYTDTYLGVDLGPGTSGFSFDVENATLNAYVQTSGSFTKVKAAGHTPATERWLRIRHASGSVFFDTSPDGIAWTQFHTVAAPAFALTAMHVVLASGGSDGTTPPSAIFDSVNPAIGSASALSLPLTASGASGAQSYSGTAAALTAPLTVSEALGFSMGPTTGSIYGDGAPLELPAFGLGRTEGRAYEYRFTPPTREVYRALRPNSRLFGSTSIGLTLYRRDGQWFTGTELYAHQLAGADRIYAGGYIHPLSADQRAELIAAGYGDHLILEPM